AEHADALAVRSVSRARCRSGTTLRRTISRMVRRPIQVTYRNRFQSGLTMLTGLFLLAVLFAILLYAFTPETPVARGPILLAAFIAILLGSLLCILFVLRWLLRPYQQLVGEAQRAPIAAQHK